MLCLRTCAILRSIGKTCSIQEVLKDLISYFVHYQVNFGVQNIQVMTFGQPRVGNAAFASYYSRHVPNTIRVVNEHDIVPHLPPYFYFFPKKTYHHFPREVNSDVLPYFMAKTFCTKFTYCCSC